jgi:hypothetical protein
VDVAQGAVLAAFNQQIRRHRDAPAVGETIERDELVVRCISAGDGWNGLSWSDLDAGNADRVISAQIRRFADIGRPWEWKHYSYDQPADLDRRLLAAGFTAEPPETLMVAEIADLNLEIAPPPGVRIESIHDEAGIRNLMGVSTAVFGEGHEARGLVLLRRLGADPPTAAAAVAWAGGSPIAAGRVEFYFGTDFAGLWGGGTLAAWRRRGVFRSLVAHRAALAAANGFRYLQVDASPDSRPVLQRLGFFELAVTTPFVHAGGS